MKFKFPFKAFFFVSLMLINTQHCCLAYNAEQKVTLSPHNIGDFLIIPIFQTLSNYETEITVMNTSNDHFVVANIVFRSPISASNVMSFLIYITPNSSWKGEVRLSDAGNPELFSTSASSLIGNDFIPSEETPFIAEFNSSSLSAGDTNTFGYIEIYGVAAYRAIPSTDTSHISPMDIFNAYQSNNANLLEKANDVPNILSATMILRNSFYGQRSLIEADALMNWSFTTPEYGQQEITPTTNEEGPAIEKTFVNTIAEVEAALSTTQFSIPFNFSGDTGISEIILVMTFPGYTIEDGLSSSFTSSLNIKFDIYDLNGSLVMSFLNSENEILISSPPAVSMQALSAILNEAFSLGYMEGSLRITLLGGSNQTSRSIDGSLISYKGAPVLLSYMTSDFFANFAINKGSSQSLTPIYLSSCTANRSKGNAPLKVDFNLNVNDDFNSYEYLWDFGDGNSSTERNPSHIYEQEGQFTPTVIVKAQNDFFITGSTHTITVEPDLGPPKAIIVAGGGPYGGNDLWETTQNLADYAYTALREQGYTEENIMYLSSETDHEIIIDQTSVEKVDQAATNSNLKEAVTEWAKDARELLIYITDHGGTEEFKMTETQYLQAVELDSWMDEIQSVIPHKIIFIYDACHSGSFLPVVTPQEEKIRINIFSSDTRESAHFSSGGEISFSHYFWQKIWAGKALYDAFYLTKEAIEDTFPNRQSPLLDANGNGNGKEHGIDGELIKETIIGDGTRKGADFQTLGSISPEQVLNGETSALIYADNAYDIEGVERVWAVINPPDFKHAATDEPVLDMPVVELLPAGNNRYEGIYDHFEEAGLYSIAIFAQNTTGMVSLPQRTRVIQTHGITMVPESPVLDIVKKGQITSFSWSPLDTATGYFLYLAPSDVSYIVNFDMGTELFLSADFASYMEGGFYAAVKAYNSSGQSDFSNIMFIDFALDTSE